MPKRVLILDSEPSATIGAYLSERGFEADLARDLAAFEEQSRDYAYDAVIADMEWPCSEGAQLLARLKQLMPEAALIATSEFTDREMEQEARRHGALYCLPKSIAPDELLQVLNNVTSPNYREPGKELLPGRQIDQFLLRGFTADQQWDFRMMGHIRGYAPGEAVDLGDEGSSMVWVETGNVLVFYNNVQVDKLGEGEFWGEESFVSPGAMNTRLIAEDSVQIRHFTRKKLMDFFAYQDETLAKRYIINLVLCLHRRCKRVLSHLAAAQQRAAEEA